jgi:predicted transcriptional regulator
LLFDDAVRIVLETRRGSVSLLQRRLNIGYARASRIIEMMAGVGVLGEYKGSQAREVMMTLEDYEQLRENMQAEMAGYEAGGSEELQAEVQKQHYEGSAEGEYHYAAIEEED